MRYFLFAFGMAWLAGLSPPVCFYRIQPQEPSKGPFLDLPPPSSLLVTCSGHDVVIGSPFWVFWECVTNLPGSNGFHVGMAGLLRFDLEGLLYLAQLPQWGDLHSRVRSARKQIPCD